LPYTYSCVLHFLKYGHYNLSVLGFGKVNFFLLSEESSLPQLFLSELRSTLKLKV
jgi:hypothetical protein